jgi:hypothetical protein
VSCRDGRDRRRPDRRDRCPVEERQDATGVRVQERDDSLVGGLAAFARPGKDGDDLVPERVRTAEFGGHQGDGAHARPGIEDEAHRDLRIPVGEFGQGRLHDRDTVGHRQDLGDDIPVEDADVRYVRVVRAHVDAETIRSLMRSDWPRSSLVGPSGAYSRPHASRSLRRDARCVPITSSR